MSPRSFRGVHLPIPLRASRRTPVDESFGQENGPDSLQRNGAKRKGYVALYLYLPVNSMSNPHVKEASEL